MDGFRFDLGTILARETNGFDQPEWVFGGPAAKIQYCKLKEIIAEPWDLGPERGSS